jgi:hypothetical protein
MLIDQDRRVCSLHGIYGKYLRNLRKVNVGRESNWDWKRIIFKPILPKIDNEFVNWIYLTQNRECRGGSCEDSDGPSLSIDEGTVRNF